ncbi:MAG: aspartate aminotransferase family protein, partial [Rhodothermales bacterium]|nr:aspartate aminotransferase family protein [Rhodothermales bacterium]
FLSTSGGGGVIQDSASSASLCAMIAARERATAGESNRRGVREDVVVYTSTEAHSSIRKAARIIGIGDENVRLIPVDDDFAMRPDALDRAVREDREAGRTPFFISATTGTTSSLAMDPLREIGALARADGLWMHVDAAMAGTAAVCPEFRWIHDGLEYADSYCFNPHKWMFTSFDCDAFYVSDRAALTRALGIMPEYLRTDVARSAGADANKQADSEAVTRAAVDFRDWQIPLGRRFRSLKLWFVLRHYGERGLRHHVREHVRLARRFSNRIEEEPGFVLLAPTSLNLVCFAHERGDDFTERLMAEVNRTGRLFVSHTRMNGRFAIRMCVGQTTTAERHADAAFDAFRETALRLTE